jgi:hypothetical protein
MRVTIISGCWLPQRGRPGPASPRIAGRAGLGGRAAARLPILLLHTSRLHGLKRIQRRAGLITKMSSISDADKHGGAGSIKAFQCGGQAAVRCKPLSAAGGKPMCASRSPKRIQQDALRPDAGENCGRQADHDVPDWKSRREGGRLATPRGEDVVGQANSGGRGKTRPRLSRPRRFQFAQQIGFSVANARSHDDQWTN